jgi:hypothetical protein
MGNSGGGLGAFKRSTGRDSAERTHPWVSSHDVSYQELYALPLHFSMDEHAFPSGH